MKPSVERLAYLIAASGLNERLIADAVKILQKTEVGQFLAHIRYLRRDFFSEDDFEERSVSHARIASDARVVDDVVRLLTVEAGLSAASASELLVRSVVEAGGSSRDLPPFRPKEGFRSWVRRLPLQSSELLHYASKIRNELLHGRSTSWPLRDRGE